MNYFKKLKEADILLRIQSTEAAVVLLEQEIEQSNGAIGPIYKSNFALHSGIRLFSDLPAVVETNLDKIKRIKKLIKNLYKDLKNLKQEYKRRL